MAITKTPYTTREDWLAKRRDLNSRGIFGGSQAGALAGISPWKSPYAIWAEATGRVVRDETDIPPAQTERMRQGRDMEEYVAKRFCELTGKSVHRVNSIIASDKHPHLFATIDRKVSNEEAGLECKKMGDFAARKLVHGDIPAQYYAQCVAYMAATELQTWYLAILTDDRFRVWVLTRTPAERPEWAESVIEVPDAEFDALDAAAADMHERVVTDTPPAADGSDSTAEAISAQFPKGGGATIDLEPLAAELAEREDILSQMEPMKERVSAIENEVKAYMGEAEAGGASGGWIVTWKTQTRTSANAKAVEAYFNGAVPDGLLKTSSARVFRVTRKN